jgi:hypothetical protein
MGMRREVPLPHGERLVVRPATRDDIPGLRALFDELPPEDRYRRFFSAYRPDQAFYERLVTAEDRGGCELVAVLDPPERVVAEAGYVLLPNGDGELAITVSRQARGWLGPYLLDALLEAAADAGIRNLEADVLLINRPMLEMLRARGIAMVEHEERTSIRLLVSTTERVPSWPDVGEGPRVLVEVPGGRWHAEDAARAAGLHVIACPGPMGPRSRCPALRGEPCPLAQGADAIVVSRPPDDERWEQLHRAHREVHPGVPVCFEVRPGPTAGEDPPGDDTVPVREPAAVVDHVARLAAGSDPENQERR